MPPSRVKKAIWLIRRSPPAASSRRSGEGGCGLRKLRKPMLPLSAMETGSIANDQPDKKQHKRTQRPNLPGITRDPTSIAYDEYLRRVSQNASTGRCREDGQSFRIGPL